MIKSPNELLAISQRAAERQAAAERKAEQERLRLENIKFRFETACIRTALQAKTSLIFDWDVSKAADLRSFTVEEVKKDLPRERFLASKIIDTEAKITQLADALTLEHPRLTRDLFPNHFGPDFFALLTRCMYKQSPAEVVTAIRQHLSPLIKLDSDVWARFENCCLPIANESLLLQAARLKHATVAEINSGISDGIQNALKISWDAAQPEYKEARKVSASKLNWIAKVWPKWEKHFNSDIEYAAGEGKTSRDWIFHSASHFSEPESFMVFLNGENEPNLEFMSDEERWSYYYWKEINNRNNHSVKYIEQEGALIGVHPLPIAEIFELLGFQVVVTEEHGFEDDDDDFSSRAISTNDLEGCSIEFNYRVKVSWASDVERA